VLLCKVCNVKIAIENVLPYNNIYQEKNISMENNEEIILNNKKKICISTITYWGTT
jgi:hypothetical protein